MYYKIKVNKTDLEFIDIVKRMRNNDGYLYLTAPEFFRLNPKAFNNYEEVLKLGGQK